jgi:L-fuconolactonase
MTRGRGDLDFAIVDAHVHFCDPERFAYKWAAREPENVRRKTTHDFAAAIAPIAVEKLVVVEAAAEDRQAGDEIAFATEQAHDDERVAGMIAGLGASDDELRASELVRGVRVLSRYAANPAFFLEEACVDRIRRLAGLGLVCEVGVLSHQLASVAALARRCPDACLILNHAGKPDLRSADLSPWAEAMREVARCNNVFCKLSGLATLAPPDARNGQVLARAIRPLIALFGYSRVLFGSDWHMVETAMRYAGWVSAVAEAIADATPGETRSLFRETARSIYRL